MGERRKRKERGGDKCDDMWVPLHMSSTSAKQPSKTARWQNFHGLEKL
jgi:hypothetical protein